MFLLSPTSREWSKINLISASIQKTKIVALGLTAWNTHWSTEQWSGWISEKGKINWFIKALRWESCSLYFSWKIWQCSSSSTSWLSAVLHTDCWTSAALSVAAAEYRTREDKTQGRGVPTTWSPNKTSQILLRLRKINTQEMCKAPRQWNLPQVYLAP